MPHAGGGYEDTSHAHEWQVTYSYDSTGHWQKCEHCNKTTEKQSHEFSEGTCTVCGYVDPSKAPPKKGAMSKYFSGVKATYAKEGIKDSDGTVKEFKNLVDRQIDVLAQDIIIRLNYVYGDLRTTKSAWCSSPALADDNDKTGDYRYYGKYAGGNNGLAARVETAALLTTLSESDYNAVDEGTAELSEVDIDNIADYQKSLIIKDANSNILANSGFFDLIGASSGQTMKVVDTGLGKPLESDESKKWLITNLTSDEAKESLKLMIAQELSGSGSDDYDVLIETIDSLGYPADFNKKLEDIINNKIIGAARITEDNGYYHILKSEYTGKITSDDKNAIDASVEYTETNSPRLYKGYKVIIPALVNSALGNKFENTDVSVYPVFSKTAVSYTSNAAGFNEAHDYQTITLLAKAKTPLTRLVVKIAGTDIGSESVKLKYQLYVNGERKGAIHRIDLTNEEQVLDLARFADSNKKFNAYSGNVITDINTDIFNYSVVNDEDTDGYIKIVFINDNGVKFKVTFDGYYDKNQ